MLQLRISSNCQCRFFSPKYESMPEQNKFQNDPVKYQCCVLPNISLRNLLHFLLLVTCVMSCFWHICLSVHPAIVSVASFLPSLNQCRSRKNSKMIQWNMSVLRASKRFTMQIFYFSEYYNYHCSASESFCQLHKNQLYSVIGGYQCCMLAKVSAHSFVTFQHISRNCRCRLFLPSMNQCERARQNSK